MNQLLKGKKGLITGIANSHSIAYYIAKHAISQGAELALSYQNEVLEKRIKPIAEELNCKNIYLYDTLKEGDTKRLIESIKKDFGKIDFILHAMAFSNRDELQGRYIDTSLNNFLNTMQISCYSLTELAKYSEEILNENSSIVTLSYLGAQKVIPNYNVMGVAKAALESSVRYLANDLGSKNIRVNTISAGPIKTLASSGISGLRDMLKIHELSSFLKRNTSQEDVARSCMYLFSDLSSGVSGETIYVDCGFSNSGMNSSE